MLTAERLYEYKAATFSDDRRYRYTLTRSWSMVGPYLVVIGLNPSTADETVDDPTIRRCIGFAKRERMSGLIMVNLFALRATDPRAMMADPDPIGPENDAVLQRETDRRDGSIVLAAWGVNGSHMGRAIAAWTKITALMHCLGVTRDGNPRHPLYVRADAPLLQFTF
jgi:hypothetical protein